MHRVVLSEMIYWDISVIHKMSSTLITREILCCMAIRSPEFLTHISAINRDLEATLLDFFCISGIFTSFNNHLWTGEIEFLSEHIAFVTQESPKPKRCVWKKVFWSETEALWRFIPSGMLLMSAGKMLFAFWNRSQKACSAWTDWHFRWRNYDPPKRL